jgi:hypothetical protein
LRKLIAGASFALVLAGGSAFAASATPQDDANHHRANDHGMCTAYFNGSDQGREKKQANGNAFEVFVAHAEEVTGDEGQAAVEAYCGVVRDSGTGDVTDPGNVGGNPDFGD